VILLSAVSNLPSTASISDSAVSILPSRASISPSAVVILPSAVVTLAANAVTADHPAFTKSSTCDLV